MDLPGRLIMATTIMVTLILNTVALVTDLFRDLILAIVAKAGIAISLCFENVKEEVTGSLVLATRKAMETVRGNAFETPQLLQLGYLVGAGFVTLIISTVSLSAKFPIVSFVVPMVLLFTFLLCAWHSALYFNEKRPHENQVAPNAAQPNTDSPMPQGQAISSDLLQQIQDDCLSSTGQQSILRNVTDPLAPTSRRRKE